MKPTQAKTYRVKDVATIAGVSVRTLHHYDEVGLLVPTRTAAGYRVYTTDDLLRLQQVLIGKELGWPLDEIQRSLDDPGFDRRRALIEQRAELQRRKRNTEAMILAIDAALSVLNEDSTEGIDDMNMKDLFEGFDPEEHEQEANARWGNTDAYRESKRRTSRYTKDDWKRMKEEQDAVYRAIANAMAQGSAPSDPAVTTLADEHRALIDKWFYPCDHALHTRLAEMYEADARFAANIDKYAEGLTPFLSAAIRENAKHRP